MKTQGRVIALLAGVGLVTACILIAASSGLTGQAMTGSGTVTPTVAICFSLVVRAGEPAPAPTVGSPPTPAPGVPGWLRYRQVRGIECPIWSLS